MATLEDYFNENMESLGLPTVSNEAWKTSTGIVAWLNAVEKAVAKSPNATIGELIAGGVLADTLVVVAGVGAAFYAGAVAGSLMVAEAKLASDYISDVDWNIFNPGNYYGQYVSITTTQTSSGSRGTVLVGDIHDENGNVVNKLDFEWSNDGQSAPVDASNGGTWQDPGAGSGGGSSGDGDSGGAIPAAGATPAVEIAAAAAAVAVAVAAVAVRFKRRRRRSASARPSRTPMPRFMRSCRQWRSSVNPVQEAAWPTG
ncbi:hypothetical protein ACQ86G_10345 [Roseateles chitinivorans]|uniref:hypothetical protein n=1 Tax=Roseateles chitinivorans TaxID=2917965 RepID=UPI003D673E3D